MEEELIATINKAVSEDRMGILVEYEDGESVEGQVQNAVIRDGQIVLIMG